MRFCTGLTTLALSLIFAAVLAQCAVPARRAVAPECTSPPRDSCAFYADCLESRYHCGPSGYPLGYGQKFCTAFSVQRDLLSPAGQTWMLDTMQCLQHALVPIATAAAGAGPTCDALEDTAFASHAPCYVDSGVCSLPPSDWAAILEIVHIKTLFQSWDAFKATVAAGSGCVEFWAYAVLHDGVQAPL